MSEETRLYVALVAYENYSLFGPHVPDPEFNSSTEFVHDVAMNGIRESEIERAKRLGTYRKTDRSRQYEGRYSPEMLLRSDNYLWKYVRERDKRKFRNHIIAIMVAAVLARIPEIVAWVERLLR